MLLASRTVTESTLSQSFIIEASDQERIIQVNVPVNGTWSGRLSGGSYEQTQLSFVHRRLSHPWGVNSYHRS